MLSDKCIIELVTARMEGRKVFYATNSDPNQYMVEAEHKWDFENNEYIIHCLGQHIKCKKEK